MKLSPFILAGSLLANAALVGVLVFRSPPASDDSAGSNSGPVHAGATIAAARADGKSTATATPTATSVSTPKLWDRIKSDDFATIATRLRAAGFPPLVVRRVITSLITEKFDARRLEIEKDNLNAPYWAQTKGTFNDPKIGPQLMALQREQTDLIKKALGTSIATAFAETDEEKAMLRFQIGDIAPEKLDQLYSVFMDYNEKRMKIYSSMSSGGGLLPSDREALASLEKGLRSDMGKFLSPAEATDFNLHASDASRQLRTSLAAFQPSEDEFRAILPLYQAFQEQFPGPAMNLTADQEAARKTALDQMSGQVKALLSPDRAADFQQAMDPASSQINRLVARLDLPISAAAQVQAVQQDIQQRAAALRSDTTVTGNDRRIQLNALSEEASAKISTALGGARGLEAYKMNGGQWLTNLQPRPKPAPKG